MKILKKLNKICGIHRLYGITSAKQAYAVH